MREPHAPHRQTATPGQKQREETEPNSDVSLKIATDSQHQFHNSLDPIPHIAPPDASDVKKIKNCPQKHEPNNPNNPTCSELASTT
jgi:hypothetical protein